MPIALHGSVADLTRIAFPAWIAAADVVLTVGQWGATAVTTACSGGTQYTARAERTDPAIMAHTVSALSYTMQARSRVPCLAEPPQAALVASAGITAPSSSIMAHPSTMAQYHLINLVTLFARVAQEAAALPRRTIAVTVGAPLHLTVEAVLLLQPTGLDVASKVAKPVAKLPGSTSLLTLVCAAAILAIKQAVSVVADGVTDPIANQGQRAASAALAGH